MPDLAAWQIVVTGRVQGVGFRPFVSRLAHEYGLSGWVCNRSGQVEIRVEGAVDALAAFRVALISRAPPLAKPEQARVSALSPVGLSQFVIEKSAVAETADHHIPPDYFVCDDCLAEMQNPAERRYRYPFINCTQCGPRYTLIDRLPYGRPQTAMADFALCPSCQAEYDNPVDRRYHAQPLACARCGPNLTFHKPGLVAITDNEAALAECLRQFRQGAIIAVKGVGGYHLMCDAGHPVAVETLRQRKSRPHKPLAVLVSWQGEDGLDGVRQLADLDVSEAQSLRSALRPIVLVRKKSASLLTGDIAPGLTEFGLMLPYSPLHHLLADGYGKPLVATSANLSGEPVLTEAQEVEQRLGRIADAFLHHNRPIRRPADDSVCRRIAGKTRPIRIGRGIAPLEVELPSAFPSPCLAVGADLKNTVALGFGNRVVISPHIGDLGSLRSGLVFEQVIADLTRLYDVKVERLVCDAHPGYYGSQWASQQGLPLTKVYHHHAHASALVGEHALTGKVLVFTWDGTGYGEDGSVWGGEALLGTPGAWCRVASLKAFSLPGGDQVAREPWRVALSLCLEQELVWTDCPEEAGFLTQVWQRRINCPLSSSAGRLFDAAASLMGAAHYSSYEGHAAMRLEALSHVTSERMVLPLLKQSSGLLVSDWGPLLPMLMNQQLSAARRGAIFHASLAGAISDQAAAIRERFGINRVGLSGGVFQNRLLTEQTLRLLDKQGFDVYLPSELPTGDGGISFGQLLDAAARHRDCLR